MSPLGHVEILFYATGNTGSQQQTISIQVALQHPFSQGRLYISTNNAFDNPIIDPQYFSHSADLTMFRAGLQLARKIGQTPPLSTVLTQEIAPGPNVNTDDEWNTYAANTIGTEFHPANTCAMLPQNQGGVVDSKLKIYGLSNVRVVDASVFPIQFATHLQWPVYGLAEQGATIIRDFWNGVSAPGDPTPSPTPSKPQQANDALSSIPATNTFMTLFALALGCFVTL